MTETPKQFLADDIVRNLPKPTKGAAKIYRDADVPGAPGTGVTGYGCRVTKAGFRALVLEYRDRETGDQKTYTIGRWPTMKVERGREIARKLRAKIEEGVDPQGEKIAKRAEPTVDELADRFEAEHLPMKKPSTAENYARLLRLYIRPQLGSMRVSAVTLADVERMCRAVAEAGGPYQANRVQAVASKLFTSAIRWGLRSPADGNPCKFVERHKEHHRRRYATTDELQRLMAALAEHPDRQSADAIRLLLLTGARRGEVLSMRWADLALDDASPKWNPKAADLKQGRDHSTPLSRPAVALLHAIRDAQRGTGRHRQPLAEYVFPSATSKTKHLVVIKRLWRNVVKAADLPGLRIHDIRHTFASQLVSRGASLVLVGSLLGHASPSTTSRYAHLVDSVEREAVDKIGAWVEAASQSETPEPPPPSGQVVKFPRGRRKMP